MTNENTVIVIDRTKPQGPTAPAGVPAAVEDILAAALVDFIRECQADEAAACKSEIA